MLYLNALQSTSCLPLHLSGGIHLKINGLTFHILNVGFISSGCDIKIYRKSKMLTAIIFKIHVYYANDAFKQKLLHKTFIAFFSSFSFYVFPTFLTMQGIVDRNQKAGKERTQKEEFPSTCMCVWGNGGIIHACTCTYSYASVVHVVVCYPSKG